MISHNKITKLHRISNLMDFLLSKNYIIFINFLNEKTLNKFKQLINKQGYINIFYINNILKKKKYTQQQKTILNSFFKKTFLYSNKWVFKGGLHAIVCYDMKMMEYILQMFSTTNLYKDKYSPLFKNNNIKSFERININLGFIMHIKISSYFFNFNTNFLDFFYILKNESDFIKNQNLFSRQIVTATVWLYKSLMMISIKVFIYLITFFFFLTKQLFICVAYANQKSIKS